ncbi:MAG: hypothetical protein HRU32_09440 [Rhodobacteraceae bacterium]|nr:hypothetical protein [Paracoccaceae bacterium]
MRTAFAFLVLCVLAACTPPPEFEAEKVVLSPDVTTPSLLPLDALIAATQRPEGASAPETDDLDARVAALQSRASTLAEAQVVDQTTRAQLDAALARRDAQ